MFLCVFVVVWEAREIPQSHQTAQAHHVGGNWCKSVGSCYREELCGGMRLWSWLTAALCKCLLTSGCLLMLQVCFGTPRSSFCCLKEGVGGQR